MIDMLSYLAYPALQRLYARHVAISCIVFSSSESSVCSLHYFYTRKKKLLFFSFLSTNTELWALCLMIEIVQMFTSIKSHFNVASFSQ